MTLGRTAWMLRRRILGSERVVIGDQVKALRMAKELGWRARLRIRALHVREVVLGPPRTARIPIAGTSVELGASRDFPIDWKAFVEVFGWHEYATASYRNAHVLDVGAHKGYFGAFALSSGAAVVRSFEPAAENYAALERAASPLQPRWTTRNAAVGATSGEGVLHLDRSSWAHSLLDVERPVGEQSVDIVTLEEALAELPAGGSVTIVKIDAEGSECDILARPESLERVDVLLVEWHSSAPCSVEELTRVIGSAGLITTERFGGALQFKRR